MTIGLYLLFNLLLANLYSHFMNRFKARLTRKNEEREKYLKKFFDQLDNDNSGYLNQM